jgi:hypothetical protein
MERLTSNKPTSDMNMLELAYNSCYADEKCNARYRDYELDIDSRKLVRDLVKDMCNEDLSDMSDEEFDEYMAEMLSVEMDSQIGLLALFYRNLWAMANLRETLKRYEDLEEQSRLIKLPCEDVYYIVDKNNPRFAMVNCKSITDLTLYEINEIDIGGIYFSTEELAEAKLKELRGGENESSN